MLRRWSSLAGVSLTAALVLIMSVVGAVPVAAAKGDVWTQQAGHPEETPKGHSQEVHLACDAVDIWADQLAAQSGTWVLSHLPPPNPPPPGAPVANGTYTYSGHDSQVVATIPRSVFEGAAGPHFKIELDNDNKKSKTFWVECGPVQPTLTTTPNPETATVGQLLKDTATLGGNLPTGTITFTLYNPGNAAVFTKAVAVNDDGTYQVPDGYVADAVGLWHWSAEYSGDSTNNQATSADEPVTVNAAQPAIVTAPNPTSGTPGVTLHDTATLTGGYEPTGSITFTLYDPDGTPFGIPEIVSVNRGNGAYTTSTGYTVDVPGTWHWSAAYGGDANNAAVSSPMSDEPVVITSGVVTTPSITTAPKPRTATVGTTLNDTARLTGEHPTGTITFTLYDPDGTPFGTPETATVNHGNGDYSTSTGYVANKVGTWHWSAAYGGDANNAAVSSPMADEPVTVTEERPQAHPAISTSPQPSATLTVGTTLHDSATLSDGNSPTGIITFTLYNPSGAAVHTEQVVVNGNGTYSTAEGHAVDMVGPWHWSATFTSSNQDLNADATSADEAVTVDPAHPAITTTPNPTSVLGSATLQDTATLSGAYHPTGTIVFTLYDPNGAIAYAETVAVDGGTSYSTSTGHLVNAPGTWHWSAAYSGDVNNAAAASLMADEPVTVTGTGEVLADTGVTPPNQLLAFALIGFGAFGIFAAVAWRRRAL